VADAQLPDRPRGGLATQPARRLARSAARAALAVTWRSLNPDAEGPFATAPEHGDVRLARCYYTTDDGWRCPLFRLDARPGSSGEPVVLAHGLGFNRHTLDFRQELSLAWALAQAGFTVFLLEHRADRSALSPPGRPRAFDFDDLATRDVPAALAVVREVTGFPRAHWVGHGLGGQLLYAWLAHARGDEIAAASALCAPVRFPQDPGLRALERLRFLLPAGVRLPTRAAAVLLSPTAAPGRSLLEQLGALSVPGDVARGLMVHGSEDLHLGLVQQLWLWHARGALTDRSGRLEYAEALEGVRTPLQLIAAQGDKHCEPAQAEPALASLAGPQECLTLDASWGHLDPLLSTRAAQWVYPRIAAWLDAHRRLAWAD